MIRSKKLGVSTIIIGYSLFGMMSGILTFFGGPVTRSFSSTISLLSYIMIAALSFQISHKDLFYALIPLNILNIALAYGRLIKGYFELSVMFGKQIDYFNRVFEFTYWAQDNNVTLTNEVINEKLGPTFIDDAMKMFTTAIDISNTTTVKALNTASLQTTEYITELLMNIPIWVGVLLFIGMLILGAFEIVTILFMAPFSLITILPVLVIVMSSTMILRISPFYAIYFMYAWFPISIMIDSFARVYLFRFLLKKYLSKSITGI